MKQYVINLKLIKLEADNYIITTKAKIGNTPVNLIVDTGASHTCFDLSFIKSLELDTKTIQNNILTVGIGGSDTNGELSIIENLKVGRLKVQSQLIGLLDLQHVNSIYQMKKNFLIHGVLGNDFFVRYSAMIDYRNMKMTLWKPN